MSLPPSLPGTGRILPRTTEKLQGRERRVKPSPDFSNLCSILIKISLALPHHPLPLPTAQTSLFMLPVYILFWALQPVSLPENLELAPPLAHGAETSTQPLEQGWTQDYNTTIIVISSSPRFSSSPSSSPTLLPVVTLDPSWVKSESHCCQVSTMLRRSLGCPTGAKSPNQENSSPRRFWAAQGPVIWRTRATLLGCPSCLPRPCLQVGAPGLRKNTHTEMGKGGSQKLSALREEVLSVSVHSSQQKSASKALKSFPKFPKAMYGECPDAHTPLSSPCALTQPPGSPLRGSEFLQTRSRTKQATGGGVAFPTPTQ